MDKSNDNFSDCMICKTRLRKVDEKTRVIVSSRDDGTLSTRAYCKICAQTENLIWFDNPNAVWIGPVVEEYV